MTIKKQICNAFNASAAHYETVAKVQREIGDRLFERLEYLKINPQYVLDLGCGTGYFSKQLKIKYPDATIVGLDLAHSMLKQSKEKYSWRQKWSVVNADMSTMPFETGIFDLVFANQVLHWSLSLIDTIRELNRVMKPNACLMFSTLGPDSFKELRNTKETGRQFAHANQFMDMHNLGDFLANEFFLDPVVDMEYLTAHYATFSDLISSLKKQGVININPSRNPGLTGKTRWQEFKDSIISFQTSNGKIPLTYEVVYGHAWKGEQRRVDGAIETRVSLSQLKRVK